MLEKLQDQLDVDVSKLVQLSMDGPNVNWSLYKILSEDLQKRVSTNFRFIDIGSCGLHTVHNAFRAGHNASEWDLGHWFSSLSWLFKDTPARREDFTTITGSTEFPLDHCAHRWVENIPVAERALKVWPHIRKFIQHMQMSKKAPRTKSFESLQASMKDELLVAKVESFISIAKLVQTFLVKYQQEAPLLPFMAHDLLLMIQSLMQRFVTIEALSYCKSAAGLLSFDFSEKNLNAPQNVDIGFKAKKALSNIAKNVSAKDILQFRIECREFLRAVVQKLLEKSPIKCKLVRNLKWMQPKAIVEDLNGCLKQLEITLSCLVAINRVNADDCDTIKSQFQQWHTSLVCENSFVF